MNGQISSYIKLQPFIDRHEFSKLYRLYNIYVTCKVEMSISLTWWGCVICIQVKCLESCRVYVYTWPCPKAYIYRLLVHSKFIYKQLSVNMTNLKLSVFIILCLIIWLLSQNLCLVRVRQLNMHTIFWQMDVYTCWKLQIRYMHVPYIVLSIIKIKQSKSRDVLVSLVKAVYIYTYIYTHSMFFIFRFLYFSVTKFTK